MSDTNRVSSRYTRQLSPGVIPVAPRFKSLRYTGAPSFGLTLLSVNSNEIIGVSRDVTDAFVVGFEVGAEQGAELLFAAHDDLWSGAMFNEWNADGLGVPTANRVQRFNNRGTTEITSVDGAGVYTVVTGTVWATNDIVWARGFAAAGNNQVTVATAGDATSVTLPASVLEATPPEEAELTKIGVQGSIVWTQIGAILALTGIENLGLAVGDRIQIGDIDGANGWPTTVGRATGRVATIGVGQVTVDQVSNNWPIADVATATRNLYFGDRLVNGILALDFINELGFLDHDPVDYGYIDGSKLNTWNLTLAPNAVAALQMGFFASRGDFGEADFTTGVFGDVFGVAADPDNVENRMRAAAAVDVGSPGAGSTPLNTSSNVARIGRDGNSLLQVGGKNAVLNATVNLNNNLRRRNAIGFVGAVSVGSGEFGVSGNLENYFDNIDIIKKLIRQATPSTPVEDAIDFQFRDADSNEFFMDLPRIKYTEGSPQVQSKNADTNLPLQYSATLDPVLGYTMKVQRIPANT